MAGIVTLAVRTTISSMYEDFFYTLGRLRCHPLTKSLAPALESFRPKLDAAAAAEINLIEKRHDADAWVDLIDADLNLLVDLVAATTLIEAKQDRTRMPYAHYFSAQRPSELKRPILGGQLDEMRNWPESLKASPNPLLQQYGAQVEEKVTIADSAANAQAKAHQAISDFRAIGGRKALVDEFNAKRKALHGQLGTIQHETPELGSGWADSFFRQGASNDKPTLNELERRIAAAEAELITLKSQREEQITQEEIAAKTKAAQEKAKKQAQLEAAKKAAAELATKVAELEDELNTR